MELAPSLPTYILIEMLRAGENKKNYILATGSIMPSFFAMPLSKIHNVSVVPNVVVAAFVVWNWPSGLAYNQFLPHRFGPYL